MADYGIANPDEDDSRTSPLLTLRDGLCGQRTEIVYVPGRYRLFGGDKILLHSASSVFESRTGASVVEMITAMAARCKTWKDNVGFEHRLRTDFTIARPAGVDAFFAYCDETEDTTTKFRYCAALAAHGDTLIEAGTAGHITRRDTVSNLSALLPRAIERLLAA